MSLKCGIVGLPNVGKSTLFNALTKAGIAAENYPFCTIDPNVGVVEVPDARVQKLAAMVKPQKTILATTEFVDIAGLVKGAAKEGLGRGNQFLDNIRHTDAIAHVVRCFEDDNIVHVAGQVDPLADIEVINLELALADLSTVEKALQKNAKIAKMGDKAAAAMVKVLEPALAALNEGKSVRSLGLGEDELAQIKSLGLITAKPAMYVANVAEGHIESNPLLEKVRAFAASEGAPVVPVCASLEAEIVDMSDEEKMEFLAETGLDEPGLNRVIRAGYALMGLQTYFTAGPQEVRAWTIPVGATAPQAAGVIHSDLERLFIRAEVISFEDYVSLGGEAGAKKAGRMRIEGKEYVVADGDVIYFRKGA